MAYVQPVTSENRHVIEVCNQIGIPYYAVNFEKEYCRKFLRIFLDEYKKVVMCNKEISLKPFLDHAMNLGCRLCSNRTCHVYIVMKMVMLKC